MQELFNETVYVIVIKTEKDTEYLSKNYYKNKHSKGQRWRKRFINTNITTDKLNKVARFNSIDLARKQVEYLKIKNVVGIASIKHRLELIDM